MSPAAQETLDRLENARQRWWICSLVCNLVFVFVVSFAAFGVCILADIWLQLSQVWLGIALLLWATLFVSLVVTAMYRGFQIPRSTEAAARRVELSLPEAGSHLINLVQLTESDSSDPFCQAAIDEAAASLQNVCFYQAANRHNRMSRWFLGLQTPQDLAERLAALALVAILAAGVNSSLPAWRSSADRLLTPWRFVPQRGVTRIRNVTPGNADVLVGSRLKIRCEISDSGDRPTSARLLLAAKGTKQTSQPMLVDEQGTSFSCTIPAVTADFQYRLEVGDSQSDLFHVTVHEPPTVSRVEITYQYPEYLRLPDRSVEQPDADLEGPQHSTAVIEFVSATPLSRGYIQLANAQVLGKVGEDRRRLRLSFPMSRSSTFTAHLFNAFGHPDPQPRINHIRVAEDSAPRVQLASPASETTVATGSRLPVVVRASDDHGLGTVCLQWRRWEESDGADSDEAIEFLHHWENVTGSAATLSHSIDLGMAALSAGQAIQIRAQASDRRSLRVARTDLLPQESTSPWVTIHLISAQQAAMELQTQQEDLSTQLREILQAQQRNRSLAAKLATLGEANRVTASIRQVQIDLQRRSVALATTMDDTGAEAAIKTRLLLSRLGSDQMLAAVVHAENLSEITVTSEFAAECGRLIKTQDAIIQTLQELLELNRGDSVSAKGELAADNGSIDTGKPPPEPSRDTPMAAMPGQLNQRVSQLMQEMEGLFDEIESTDGGGDDSPESDTRRKRMAASQADLRQRAEAVRMNFQILRYQQTDLNRIVELMRSVEADLRSGQYHNSLRRREVLLDGLRDVKTYLGGELEIRRERPSHLPTPVQEQLMGSMLDESPPGWTEWNRRYFERLSGDASTPTDAEP